MKLPAQQISVLKVAMLTFFLVTAFQSTSFSAESAAPSVDEKAFDTGWKRPKGKFNYSKANKMVVHFNSLAEEPKLGKMLHSFQHIRTEVPKIDIKVVVHGEALKIFREAVRNESYRKFIEGAREAGVQFRICHNSLINMKIKVSELYSIADADLVPAAIPEIVMLQKEGYSYIRYF